MHKETHSLWMGYAMWILGFTGAHRFYYGKRVSGLIYLCTLGLFGIGWLFDLFWMPMLYKGAKKTYYAGDTSYDLAWILLTFGGYLGLHRFYLGKFVSGLVYLCTAGLFTFGIWYDFLFMNEYVAEANRSAAAR